MTIGVKTLFLYYLVLTVWLFILMAVDKRKARKNAWRIKEKSLWILAAFGGAIGGTLAMRMFHHKTKHTNFKVGFPLLALFHLLLLCYIGAKFYL
ncbi:DUF1294 domain-containing protein [Halobacillus rhizosphaerae]|uniref:DUF1294 domain-containing protein n=1 Tax=Halobacillus rhizosphaerae TaxID=3064889 RepID=UPI00398BA02D